MCTITQTTKGTTMGPYMKDMLAKQLNQDITENMATSGRTRFATLCMMRDVHADMIAEAVAIFEDKPNPITVERYRALKELITKEIENM